MLRRALFLALVLAAGPSSAQVIGDWTFGPSLPVISFTDEAGDLQAEFLGAGAGFSARRHLLVSPDGSLSYISVELPFFVSANQDAFRFEVGGIVSFFNGLVGVGVSVLGADTGTDQTFADGEIRGLLVLGFNVIGSGVPAGASKATVEPPAPFNCVRW